MGNSRYSAFRANQTLRSGLTRSTSTVCVVSSKARLRGVVTAANHLAKYRGNGQIGSDLVFSNSSRASLRRQSILLAFGQSYIRIPFSMAFARLREETANHRCLSGTGIFFPRQVKTFLNT